MIFVVGISIALFSIALLLNKKNTSKSDKVLLIWMLLMAGHLMVYFLKSSVIVYPFLIGVSLPLPLLEAVLLFFYVSAATNQFPKNKLSIIAHFIPTILSYIFLIPFFLATTEEQINLYKNHDTIYGTYYYVANIVSTNLAGIIYVVWSMVLLKRHKKNVLNSFSNIEDVSLNWLRLLIVGMAIIWSIIIFTNNGDYIFIAVSLFVILIGYFGIQQKRIFHVELTQPSNIEEKKVKYATSGLSKEMADKKYQDLLFKIEDGAYYKENNLSLKELALKLNLSPNYVSQIINEKEGKNYYDFINTFRAEAFKALIMNPSNKQYTLLALAYECGFTSKSSFNRFFKKYTGSTPTQYITSLKK